MPYYRIVTAVRLCNIYYLEAENEQKARDRVSEGDLIEAEDVEGDEEIIEVKEWIKTKR